MALYSVSLIGGPLDGEQFDAYGPPRPGEPITAAGDHTGSYIALGEPDIVLSDGSLSYVAYWEPKQPAELKRHWRWDWSKGEFVVTETTRRVTPTDVAVGFLVGIAWAVMAVVVGWFVTVLSWLLEKAADLSGGGWRLTMAIIVAGAVLSAVSVIAKPELAAPPPKGHAHGEEPE